MNGCNDKDRAESRWILLRLVLLEGIPERQRDRSLQGENALGAQYVFFPDSARSRPQWPSCHKSRSTR